MPDTARTFAEIITLLPDQTTQDISPQDLRDAMQSIATPISGGGFDNTLGMPKALAGATQATRYVGARATAAPTANTWQLGDFMILQNGGIAVCTAAGTPGTWVTISASGAIAVKSLAQYTIYKSGSNFVAHNNDTGVDDYSGTDAAAVVQSAHDSAPVGSLIELTSGLTYSANTQVILSKDGTMVRSREQPGEDQSTHWSVNTALSAGSAAFRMTGIGAAIGGISIECNSNSDYGIDMRSAGGLMFYSNVQEADVANYYLDGPNGAARCMIWGLRSNNPAASGGINYKFDGPDHIAWGIRATGAATNGYALWMDTSRMVIASGHITGTNDEAGNFLCTGSENRLSDFYFDTGPAGINGNAHMQISGSGNWISALIQNAATDTARDVTAITQVGGGASTVWQFTTSAAHGYAIGDAVWIEGFAVDVTPPPPTYPSPGASQNTLVTAVTTTTFNVDLGVATNPFVQAFIVSKRIVKYALLFRKSTSTSFVQGNEVHINFQGKGAGGNDGEFYYAVGFLDESGNNITSFARFAGNRIYGNAAKCTRFSNLEATWGTTTHSDKIFADVWHYQTDTTTPMIWRTRSQGVTGSVSATTVTVQHGLAGLPSRVMVTPRGDPAGRVWVSGITATQFVINSSAAPTAITYGWAAEM